MGRVCREYFSESFTGNPSSPPFNPGTGREVTLPPLRCFTLDLYLPDVGCFFMVNFSFPRLSVVCGWPGPRVPPVLSIITTARSLLHFPGTCPPYLWAEPSRFPGEIRGPVWTAAPLPSFQACRPWRAVQGAEVLTQGFLQVSVQGVCSGTQQGAGCT